MSEQSSDVVLMNGFTSARTRASDGTTVLACGCACTDLQWIQMCRPHFTGYEALHRQAQIDLSREAAVRELTS